MSNCTTFPTECLASVDDKRIIWRELYKSYQEYSESAANFEAAREALQRSWQRLSEIHERLSEAKSEF